MANFRCWEKFCGKTSPVFYQMKRIIFTILILLTSAILNYSQQIEQTISIPPLNAESKRYFYFPFEVPSNTKSIVVEYIYDKKDGANTLDLGLFDVNFDETEKTMSGFRGWSGGRRNKIFIAENSATNGYAPGKIHAGKWRVIFGLYKVAAEGVEVKIKVKFNEVADSLLQQPRAESEQKFNLPKLEKLPSASEFNGLKWFRGDLHIHTFHSDGHWTVPLIFDWATNLGLDFVSLTEHNTFSHHREINRLSPQYPNLLVLRGEEVTTYGGHFNIWGLPNDEIIDFRVMPNNQTELLRSLNRVRQLNLPASMNHPTALCGGCSWSYGDWVKMDSIEIWNGDWDATDEITLKQWDTLLQQGKILPVIGSSDSHQPPLPVRKGGNPSLGEPTNHVGMKKLSQSELLSAIKYGRIWMSDLPKNYRLEFTALDGKKRLNLGETGAISNQEVKLILESRNFPADSSVRVISNGKIIHEGKAVANSYKFEMPVEVDSNTYFRVEIRDSTNKMLALTNPIYFRKTR